MTASRREAFFVALLLLAIGAVYLATLPPGHDWGGDFAQYLAHAENLAEGRPYGETGYVFNPHSAITGPHNYPPVYPAVLSLGMRAWGPDLMVAKRITTLCLLLGYLAIWAGVRRRLGAAASLAVLLSVALNPHLFQMRAWIVSEQAFFLFAFLALLLFDSLETRPGRRSRLAMACATGLISYLAIGTRSLGLLLLPSYLLYDLLRLRRLRGESLLAVAIATGLALLEHRWLAVVEDYGAQVGSRVFGDFPLGLLRNLAGNAVQLPVAFSEAWRGDLSLGFELPFAVGLLGLAGVGGWAALRGRYAVAVVFAAVYLAALGVLPSDYGDLRRLLPLLPVFAFLVALGIGRLPGPWRPITATLVCVGLAVSYVDLARQLRTPRDVLGQPEVASLFAFVHEQTEPDAVLVFFKPRVLAHFTGRRSAVAHRVEKFDALADWLREIDARYLVVKRGSTEDALADFEDEIAERLPTAFQNPAFAVFRRVEPASRPAEP